MQTYPWQPSELDAMTRAPTGVAGLDKMLRGGLVPGRPYVISGTAGSGKTILCLQFLLEGMRNNESVILITVDEPPNEVKSNAAPFGWDLGGIRILDATPDIKAHSTKKSIIDVGTTLDVKDMEDVEDIRKSSQLRTMEVSVHSVQKMLKQEFADHLQISGKRYSRIVVDSMTALRMYSMKQDANILIQSFLRFLAELEATTLITSDLPSKNEILPRFSLTRGEIRMHKWVEGTKILRAISVEKLRGSPFDDRFRPMSIGPKGMVVDAEGMVNLNGKEPDLSAAAYLENILSEEAFEVMEQVLVGLQEAYRKGVATGDLQAALLRAVLFFNLKRYDDMVREAAACLDKLRQRLAGPGAPEVKVAWKPGG